MLSTEVREAAAKIGNFYLQKNNGDYTFTEKELIALQITSLEVTDERIKITTACPGMLIGKKGTNISELEKFVGMKISIIEERDPLTSWLIPHPDSLYDVEDEYYQHIEDEDDYYDYYDSDYDSFCDVEDEYYNPFS